MTGFVIIVAMLIAILGGASYYIAYRIYQGLLCVLPGARFWPVMAVVSGLTVVMVLGFARSMLPVPDVVKHILNLISSYYMGIFLYLVMFTLLADLVLVIPRLMNLSFTGGRSLKGIMTLCVLVLTGLTCCYGFWNARHMDHVSYEIPISGKANISDMNIVMISDLHLGAVGSESRLEEIVDQINAQHPDLVCIAGDIFDSDFAAIKDPEKAAATLKKLSATYGVYACLGNHDAGTTARQMTDFLENCSIHLLADEYAVIDERLVLVGRLDGSPIGGYGDQARKPLTRFLTGVDESLPVIVLDHNPGNIGEYGQEADLILCGHTHNGQLFPATLITDGMYAVDHGYYQKDSDSPHVVVTSGVGYWGMPMRVGTDCEIVTIHFI